MGRGAEPDSAALSQRVQAFVDEHVVPLEGPDAGEPGVREKLQQLAREAGIFGPTVSRELGGLGLSMMEQAPVLEAAGRSLLGPLALNCAAPDEGNIHLLDRVADEEQRKRYLEPLARGDVRSAFAMTEPAPGAGSDPSALRTTAVRKADGWRLDGTKWFITGADGAAFFIVMARTAPHAGTLFLVDAGTPGLRVGRHIPTMDRGFTGGHCEVHLDGCTVPADAVLGHVDAGFAHAQVRLAPARLTHCMRWLGIAQRAQEVAVRYAASRELFGSRLADLGMAQQHIADNEIDLAASRALVLTAAAALDRGERGGEPTSIAKTFVAEAVNRVVDRALQLCGASGVSHDLPLARFAAEIRPFRIYDGASEVHRWSLARRAVRRYAPTGDLS
jgi:alkylation response protein AidB-like acyl-CoA dehydrogenase